MQTGAGGEMETTRITPESGPGAKKEKNQNIQVFVRVRPMNSQENSKNAAQVIDTPGSREVVVRERSVACLTKTFTFDRVFGPRSKQVDVYKTVVAPLLTEVLLGYNCTVFAYGQTGTGKTFTMEGERSQKSSGPTVEIDPQSGILPRALSQLFDEVRLMNCEFTVRVSFLELYNEELFDLLAPIEESKTKTLRLFEDSHRKGSVIIQGLEEVIVNNKQEVYSVLDRGSQQRKTAATLMNASSSRSHTIFTITVHLKESSVEGEEMLKVGKLHLVDLAGSENIGKSGAVDKRAREAGSINQSLLTLGRVISALVERTPHVPYRESKLTRLLQDSLGGKTKTSIIATVSPAGTNIEETLSTLDYAHRAKNIMNKPEVNQKLTKKEALNIYTDEIERLRRDLNATRDKNGVFMDSENYNRTMAQINAQHAELNDKSNKIKELEDVITEKEEAEREMVLEMDELKTDIAVKQKLLEDARAAQEALRRKLQTEEKRADELKYLVKYHLETEEKITGEASTLLTTTTDSMAVIESLHNRLERKQTLEDRNWGNAQRFREEYKKTMDEIIKTVQELRESHTLSISDIRDKFDTRASTRRHLLEAFAKALNSTSSALEKMNTELLGTIEKQVGVVECRATAAGEMISTQCDTAREAMTLKMKTIAECVKSLKTLFESLQSENLTLEKSIDQEFAKMSAEVKNTILANTSTFERLQTVLVEVKQKWSDIHTDGLASFNSFKTSQDKYKESCNRKIIEMRKELEYFKQKATGMQEMLEELTTETSETIEKSEGTFKQVVSAVDTSRKVLEPVLNNSCKSIEDANLLGCTLNAHLENFQEQNVGEHKKFIEGLNERLRAESRTLNKIGETSKSILSDQRCTLDQVAKTIKTNETQLLNDMKQLNNEMKEGIQNHGAEALCMKESCYIAVKSLNDGEHEHSKELLSLVNNQCDKVSTSATKANRMLLQTTGNVDEFWEETYMVDRPSGGTPMRRKYDYPSKLTYPSPHERVMARYREVSKQIKEALEDSPLRGPDDLDCSWSDNYFKNLNVPVMPKKLAADLGSSEETESDSKEDVENQNPTDEQVNKKLESIVEGVEPKESKEDREPEPVHSSASSDDVQVCTPRFPQEKRTEVLATGTGKKGKSKQRNFGKKAVLKPPN